MRRERQDEIMDQPRLGVEEHRRALAGLERLNRACRTAAAFWPAVAALASEVAPRPLRVLDLATGAGDLPRALAERARRGGVALEVAGCDRHTIALDYARDRTTATGARVEYFRLDALREPLPSGWDVICCSLFLHHLEEGSAAGLLRAMAAAAERGVIVDDLLRSRRGLGWAWVGSRLLQGSPVVREDALLSVRGAFTAEEARGLAAEAGLRGYKLRLHWPQRFQLEWRKKQ